MFQLVRIPWNFKCLSVREINPTAEHEEEPPAATPAEPEPAPEEPIETPTPIPEPVVPETEISYPEAVIAGQHFPDNNNNVTTISAIDLKIKKMPSIEGDIVVAISKDGNIVAGDRIDITNIGRGYVPLTAQFSGINVAGEAFDVLVLFEDSGNVAAAAVLEDYMPGNFFNYSGEYEDYDMDIVIR